MRLGAIARADNSGLGIQTYEFVKHMKPAKTLVVDISKLNGNRIYPERYPDAQFARGIPTHNDLQAFLRGLDCVFIAEAPYNYSLYALAREMGVKTAVQYNYEFFDWYAHPDWPKPDMLIAPSKWHYNEINEWCANNNVQHTYLHCPVNRDAVLLNRAVKARNFLHPAGRSAAHDRNGTKTVIEASRYLKTDATIRVHFQGEQGLAHQTTMTIEDYRQYAKEHGNPEKLVILQREWRSYAGPYTLGDVLVLPRRYGGNCLPMNEGLAAGMPVIMSSIEPNDSFLPTRWLTPARKIGEFTPRTTIDIYEADPVALAEQIDRFYLMNRTELEVEQENAIALSKLISWTNMAQQYEAVLGELCGK